MIRNLVIGNGVNIQHGGFDFSNTAIILRTLQCFKDPNFPKHILTDDPIEAKCYIGYLFLEIPRILSGDYDALANCSAERSSLYEFKTKYSNKATLKILILVLKITISFTTYCAIGLKWEIQSATS